MAESNTGEGENHPETQNLSNQLSESPVSKQCYLFFFSIADVEEEIVSRGGLQTL